MQLLHAPSRAAGFIALLGFNVAAVCLHAQSVYESPYTITTLAGGVTDFADGTGSLAGFGSPRSVVVDPSGNIFVADSSSHSIRKITPEGVVTTLAGLGGFANFGTRDGVGSDARFYIPAGIAFDPAGNLLVTDNGNHTLRKITPEGVVTTLAGAPKQEGSVDGIGGAARFISPTGVVVDGNGTIFVADSYNATIRRITPAGVVTTFAGQAEQRGLVDGIGSAARFSRPSDLALDGSGNLVVSDPGNQTIRKITPAGLVTTLAGRADDRGIADGPASAARFFLPRGLVFDRGGNLFVADSGNHTIRRITPAGIVTTVAGRAEIPGWVDGTGTAAQFEQPAGLALDGSGNLVVADMLNFTIRRISPAAAVTTVAGVAIRNSVADGTGAGARFKFNSISGIPSGVAVDGLGNVFVADSENHTIRKVTAAGVVSTFAGLGGTGGGADGPGSVARFANPNGVAVDRDGNVYVADSGNNTIRKITSAGVVTTLAGLAAAATRTDTAGSADGTGSAARFNNPKSVAVDRAGNVFVGDSNNATIRKITPAGVVTTFAGLAGQGGSADGTGSAARFLNLTTLAVDDLGNVFVADYYNCTIRKITPAGVVTTIAGVARQGGHVDGVGNAARFSGPMGIALDGAGNAIVADGTTLRRVSPGGIVTTLAGLADQLGSLDGTGSAARFWTLLGVAADREGTVYMSELAQTGNRKDTLRKGVPSIAPLSTARLVNLSVRKAIGPDILTAGFVLSGTATKPVLVRAIGPALRQFGVTNALASPSVTLYLQLEGGRLSGIAENRFGWGNGVGLATTFAQVGAFPLEPGSADTAVLSPLVAGDYSAVATSLTGARGEVLMEVYDTDPGNTAARLANLSVLATAGAGDNVLTAGFVVGGGTLQLLIRAVGPGLERFGVTGVLAAPTLTVFSGNTPIATNSGWRGAAELSAAFAKVAAFALPANSADAALLLTLPSGNYSAQVTGAGSSTGNVIVEVYEVPTR